MTKNTERRDFLKFGVAATAAVAIPSTVLAQSNNSEIAWDETSDVVVVGSGLAGLSAAYAAAEQGLGVVVLEKMRTVGGNSIICAGSMAVAGSDLQAKEGIKDSPELMYQDMLTAGNNLNHPELTRHVCEQSGPLMKEYVINKWNVKFRDKIMTIGGHSVPRSLTTTINSGSSFINGQLEACKKLNVSIRTSTFMEEIIKNENGHVIGVKIRERFRFGKPGSGNVKYIKATKGVVLAAGGFTADSRYIGLQEPTLVKGVENTGQRGATAETLLEALRNNCNPIHLSWVQQYPLSSPDEKGFGFAYGYTANVACVHGILVNVKTSKRFVNELANRKVRADAIIKTGEPAIAIADSIGFSKVTHSKIPLSLDNGSLKSYSSIDELAIAYGLSVDTLKEQIDRYNQMVEEGKDQDFGRKLQTKIEKAPFYAARVYPKIHHCMGGIQINKNAEAIDTNGNVIKGLYAAGEFVGGVHGAVRLGTCAMIDCVVFGITAGKSVASA